jgi:hypothetical protein
MTEFNGGPLGYASAGADYPFRNWRTGAMVMGIIAIIMGAFSGCMTALMPLALMFQNANVHVAGAPQRPAMQTGVILSAMELYLAIAITLIWLGVGAIKLQRWVRPMFLVLGTMTLVSGIFGVIGASIAVPAIMSVASAGQAGAAPPRAALLFGILVGIGFVAVIMLVIPAVYVWFFRNANVKMMLEYFDPKPRWTDRIPLPALGVVVGFDLYAAICVMGMTKGMVPFFGRMLTGFPAVTALGILAAISLVLALYSYRLKPRAWWAAMGFVIVLAISYIATSLRGDAAAMYRDSGMNEEQVAAIARMQSSNPLLRAAMIAPMFLAVIGYLLYARRFFTGQRLVAAPIGGSEVSSSP